MIQDSSVTSNGRQTNSFEPLSNFAVRRRGSVDPKKFPDEEFELFSIPAYDAGSPEYFKGAEIGSSKKIVRPGDVLISRIVPHIQRVWVVPKANGRRQIASGEWLIFRGEQVAPEFLRHMLLSKPFYHQFMRTVAGVGGSLLRARPSEVERIEIPIPKYLEEQRRIAAILDMADGICRKREQALAMAGRFLRSAFDRFFSDLQINPKGWETAFLGNILSVDPQNGLYRPSKDYGSGTYILRIDGFYDGYLARDKPLKQLRIDQNTIEKYLLRNGDIVINRVNSREYLGKSTLIESLTENTVFESNMMRFRVQEDVANPRFLVDQLQTQFIKRQVLRASKDAVNQSSINQTDVKNLEVRLPPIELQAQYAEIVANKTSVDGVNYEALAEAKLLFESLSQRAFRGEL